jgi:hypothetical protein
VLVASALASTAQAASSLIVDSYTLGERISIRYGGDDQRVWTAEFSGTLIHEDMGKTLVGASYCIDLDQYLGVETVTPVTVLAPSSSERLLAASTLLDDWYGITGGYSRTTAITGLQIAIWETYYDLGAANLAGGNFQVTSASSQAMAFANLILGSLPASLSEGDLDSLVLGVMSARRQDQLFISTAPIPEPASMLLFLVGGALTSRAVSRRR